MTRATYVRNLDVDYGPLFRGFVQALRRCEVPRAIVLDFAQDPAKRRYLLKRFVEDAAEERLKCHEEFLERLIAAGENLAYRQRVAWAAALNQVYAVTSPELQEKILGILLNSKYRPVRRQGYTLCRGFESKHGLKLLMNAWRDEPDPELAEALVYEAPDAFLKAHFSDLIDLLERDAAVTHLYLRSAAFDPEAVHGLARSNPISYLYVMAKLGRTVHKEFCWYVLVTYATSPDSGLVLWALGRQGHWEILKELHERPPGSVWTGGW